MIFRLKFRIHGGTSPGKFFYNVREGATLYFNESFRPAAGVHELAHYGVLIRGGVTSVALLKAGALCNGAPADKGPVLLRPGYLLASNGVTVEILECPVIAEPGRDVTQFLDLGSMVTTSGVPMATGPAAAPVAPQPAPVAQPVYTQPVYVQPAPAQPAPAATVSQPVYSQPARFEDHGVDVVSHYEVPDKVVVPISLDSVAVKPAEAPAAAAPEPQTKEIIAPPASDPIVAVASQTYAVEPEAPHPEPMPMMEITPQQRQSVRPPEQTLEPDLLAAISEEPTPPPMDHTPPPLPPAPRVLRPRKSFYLDEEPTRLRVVSSKRAFVVGAVFAVLILVAAVAGPRFNFEFLDDNDKDLFTARSRISKKYHTRVNPDSFAHQQHDGARTPASGTAPGAPAVTPLPAVAPDAPPAPKKPDAADLKELTDAIDTGNMPVVLRLVESERVSPDFALDDLGRSPFLRAASAGRVTAMQYLLTRKVSTAATDYNGNTALMWAVINGHEKTVKFLLSLGLDPHTKRDDGKDSFQLAREYRQKGIANVLHEAFKSANSGHSKDDRRPAATHSAH